MVINVLLSLSDNHSVVGEVEKCIDNSDHEEQTVGSEDFTYCDDEIKCSFAHFDCDGNELKNETANVEDAANDFHLGLNINQSISIISCNKRKTNKTYCEECDKHFISNRNFKRHMTDLHQKKDTIYCD
jgi:hypothetical protein